MNKFHAGLGGVDNSGICPSLRNKEQSDGESLKGQRGKKYFQWMGRISSLHRSDTNGESEAEGEGEKDRDPERG